MISEKYRAAHGQDQARRADRSNVVRFPDQLVEKLRRLRSIWRPEKAPVVRSGIGPNAWSSAEEWREFTLRQWLSRRAVAAIDWGAAVAVNDSRDDAPQTGGQRLPFHPAADKLPLMNDAETAALAADIEANGQRDEVELLDGMVIDGRNIVNACYLLGREPRTRTLSDNTNPTDHLISKNLMRKHHTKLERAMFAARMVTTGHGGGRNFKSPTWRLDAVTQADAARRIGVSKRDVERATFVLDQGVPELVAAIDAGIPWLTVSYADKIARSGEDDQRAWIADRKHVINPVKRTARPPRTPIPFTDRQLKALNDQQALVIVEKLMPKANRALKAQGEQWNRVKLTKEEP